jgi:hypothetical protein
MAYAKFDDGFADHPKNRGLSDGAFRLHVTGILHCARWLTDGQVTAEILPDLMRRYRPAYLAELLERGLWREVMADALYEIHDYTQWNDTRAKVEARRHKNAERLAKWRAENGRGDAA